MQQQADVAPELEKESQALAVLIFAVVAVLVLGPLLAFSSFVPGGRQRPASNAASPAVLAANAGGSEAAVVDAGAAGTTPPLVAGSLPAPQPAAPALPPLPAGLQPPQVSAHSFAIIQRSCGRLLYGLNEHDRVPPASTTKIITALVTLQRVSLDDMVDIDVSGSQMARRGSSVMGIEPGMRLSVRDLVYGLLLPSGNDAALALARYIGNHNEAAFVSIMNDEAAALHMNDTHFANPHGLDNPDHYSSAYDMALAGRALLDNPFLAGVVNTPTYAPAWDGPELKNGNRLLKDYPGAFGVKIGYTTNAKDTFVAAADRDGRQLIVSLMGSDDRYADATNLFDWAFSTIPEGCPAH